MISARELGFTPGEGEFARNPFPVYQRMRQEAPVLPFHHDGTDYWVFSRYGDIDRALKTWQDYTVTKGMLLKDAETRLGRSLATTDPPDHERLRRVFNRAFAPARIRQAVDEARHHAEALASACAATGQFDAISEFARPFVNRAMSEFIGLPKEAQAECEALMVRINAHRDALGSPFDFSLLPTLNAFIRERTRDVGNAGDSIVAVLKQEMQGEIALSEEEVVASIAGIMLAAFSSSVHFLGNLLFVLDTNRDVLTKMREDPSFVTQVIEECSRFEGPGHAFARSAVTSLQIGDVTIPEGGRVILIYGSGNRDESVIPDAERFLPGRKTVRHFGFGGGPHFCIGSMLARSLAAVGIQALTDKIGLDYAIDLESAQRPATFQGRGFDALQLECRAA